MAKKKTKAAKKEMPAKKVKKSSSMGWIIAAIVVIVIAAYLILMQPAKTAAPTQTTQQPTTPAATGALTTATAPTINAKCVVPNTPTGPTIGIVPGTETVTNNVVTFTIKNSGKTDITSTYFSFADIRGPTATGKTVWKLNSDAIAVGATATYTVDLNQVATELGSAVDTFTVYPVMGGQACQNGAIYVIKLNS